MMETKHTLWLVYLISFDLKRGLHNYYSMPLTQNFAKNCLIGLTVMSLLSSCYTVNKYPIQNHPLYFEENMETGDLLKIHLKNGEKVQLELVEFDKEKLVGRTGKISIWSHDVILKKSLDLTEVYYEDAKVIYHFEKSKLTFIDYVTFAVPMIWY